MNAATLQQRAYVTKGTYIVSILFFIVLAILAFFSEIEPAWSKWAIFVMSIAGLLFLVLWRSRNPGHESGYSDEELMELAKNAMQLEADRLEAKRQDLGKILMAYGEWMEFPDFEILQTNDWKDEAHLTMDTRVAELLDDESDLLLQRFSTGVYWIDGEFEGRQLLNDLVTFSESIARIYRPESERPLLELNLESLLKAVNRASIQLILLLEEIPFVDAKGMSLRKFSEHLRTASKVYRTYEDLLPIINVARNVWRGGLLIANPLANLGWIAGSEALWKGAKHHGKKAWDAYVLSLLRQALGIVAWETAGIYDPTHRYRNPDWIFGVELAHLLSKFDETPKVLRETFRELGSLSLRSSYDRIFLYRCIAKNVSPKPELFAQAALLSLETREKIFERLTSFYDKHVGESSEMSNKATLSWRRELESRLGLEPS